MIFSKERSGELLILLCTILIGFGPIFLSISARSIHPLLAVSFTYFFASIYFAFFLPSEKKIINLKKGVTWKYLLLQFFLSILEYSILFYALSLTSALNIGILELLSTFFTFIVLILWKKESVSPRGAIGAILIIIGASLILFDGTIYINIGNLIFALSKILVPFGDYYSKKARSYISTGTIMFFRSILSFIILFVIYLYFVGDFSIDQIYNIWPYLLINGIIFFGLQRNLWLEGTYRIAITKASTILAFSPIVTLLFSYLIYKTMPTEIQVMAIIPMIIGCLLITRKASKDSFIVNEEF